MPAVSSFGPSSYQPYQRMSNTERLVEDELRHKAREARKEAKETGKVGNYVKAALLDAYPAAYYTMQSPAIH